MGGQEEGGEVGEPEGGEHESGLLAEGEAPEEGKEEE